MSFNVDMTRINALKEYLDGLLPYCDGNRDIKFDMESNYHDILSNEGWNIYYGASKFVLINHKKDFVIKFSTTEYKNYVRAEAVIYKEAIKRGLDMLFPETELVPGTDIVLQRKVDFSVSYAPNEFFRKICRQTQTVNTEIIDDMRHDILMAQRVNERTVNFRWLSLIVVLYGKKKIRELVQLIEDFDINDLHEDNIGFLNGRPVFLDFSGFDPYQ